MRSQSHSGAVPRWHGGVGVWRWGLWQIRKWFLYSEILSSGKSRHAFKNLKKATHLFTYCILVECFYIVLMKYCFWCCFLQKVEQLCNKGIKKVSCATQFSVALACDGHVYTFGQGNVSIINVTVLIVSDLCQNYATRIRKCSKIFVKQYC